jgi:hypothetical protein
MPNMSYCRFQNTLMDFEDCKDALEELATDGGKLSAEELRAAKALAIEAREFLTLICESANIDFEDIDSDAKLEGALDFIVEQAR